MAESEESSNNLLGDDDAADKSLDKLAAHAFDESEEPEYHGPAHADQSYLDGLKGQPDDDDDVSIDLGPDETEDSDIITPAKAPAPPPAPAPAPAPAPPPPVTVTTTTPRETVPANSPGEPMKRNESVKRMDELKRDIDQDSSEKSMTVTTSMAAPPPRAAPAPAPPPPRAQDEEEDDGIFDESAGDAANDRAPPPQQRPVPPVPVSSMGSQQDVRVPPRKGDDRASGDRSRSGSTHTQVSQQRQPVYQPQEGEDLDDEDAVLGDTSEHRTASRASPPQSVSSRSRVAPNAQTRGGERSAPPPASPRRGDSARSLDRRSQTGMEQTPGGAPSSASKYQFTPRDQSATSRDQLEFDDDRQRVSERELQNKGAKRVVKRSLLEKLRATLGTAPPDGKPYTLAALAEAAGANIEDIAHLRLKDVLFVDDKEKFEVNAHSPAILKLVDDAFRENSKSLSLAHQDLGSVPARVTRLRHLENLMLQHNLIFELPVGFGRLKNLKVLALQHNKLASLPAEFGSLSNLTELYLSHNKLEALPQTFNKLSNLAWLDLSDNRLTTFPLEVVALAKLRTLDMSNNKLTSLPMAIGEMWQLRGLYLTGNSLTSLPPSVNQFINMTTLALEGNQIASLPLEIMEMTALVRLMLDHNPVDQKTPFFLELKKLMAERAMTDLS